MGRPRQRWRDRGRQDVRLIGAEGSGRDDEGSRTLEGDGICGKVLSKKKKVYTAYAVETRFFYFIFYLKKPLVIITYDSSTAIGFYNSIYV